MLKLALDLDSITVSAGGGVQGRPDWLNADATDGINFLLGEAWVNEVFYDDLTPILGSNYNPANLGVNGYDQNNAADGIIAIGPLQTRLAAMDWAVRAEFQYRSPVAISKGYIVAGNDETNGFDLYFDDSGDVYAEDWNWNTEPLVGHFEDYEIHTFSASNNVAGWLASFDGGTAVLNDVQTPPFAEPSWIGIGCSAYGENDPRFIIDGYLRKYEFFPLRNAAQLESLSAGELTPPEGFAFVVDSDGKYVVDGDGAYVVTEI